MGSRRGGDESSRARLPGTAAVLGCELRGVRAPFIGSGGETPPELAGEDACGTRAKLGRTRRFETVSNRTGFPRFHPC